MGTVSPFRPLGAPAIPPSSGSADPYTLKRNSTSSRFTHKASAASPTAAARRGAGSSGVGQLPSTTGAGRASADTIAEYPHETPRTVKTGASSRWAWTGCCADDRGTRQQAQRVPPLRRQSGQAYLPAAGHQRSALLQVGHRPRRGDAPIVCTRRSASCPSTPRSGRDQGNRPGWLRVRPGGPNATVEVSRNQTVTPLSVRKN